MSKYFHVVFSNENKDSKLLYKNLNEKELKKSFIKRFQKNKNIFIDGEVFKISNFKKVQIIRTDFTHEEELKKYTAEKNESRKEVNKTPGPKIMPYFPRETDIVFCGNNVTSNYLNEAPSNEKNLLSKFITHPMTVKILGGLIFVLLVWLIATYFGLAL